MACQIWDSAADITEIPVGLPKSIFPKNPTMQSALRNYTLYVVGYLVFVAPNRKKCGIYFNYFFYILAAIILRHSTIKPHFTTYAPVKCFTQLCWKSLPCSLSPITIWSDRLLPIPQCVTIGNVPTYPSHSNAGRDQCMLAISSSIEMSIWSIYLSIWRLRAF